MESTDQRQLRCPECLAESPATSDRCTKCGAALFPTGFDLGKFRARPSAAAGGLSEPVTMPEPPEQIEPIDVEPEPVSPPQLGDASADAAWVAPRLYDEETETLTPEAFHVFGAAVVDEARTQHQPLALLLVVLSGGEATDGTAPGEEKAHVQALAGVLRRSQRSSDLVARHGTRGFALLLSGMSLAQAGHTARWVEMVMRQSPLGAGDRAPELAQGIAELTPGADLSTLLQRAEEALAPAGQSAPSGVASPPAPQPADLMPRELAIPQQPLSPTVPRALAPAARPAKKRRRRFVRTAQEVSAPVRSAKDRQQPITQTVRADVIGQEEGAAFAVSLRVDMALDGPRADVEIRRR